MVELTTSRRTTSFRFPSQLIDALKSRAKEDNLSMNSYVESILANAMKEQPNPVTCAAIKEAKENDDLETLDLDNFELYVKSL